MPRHPLTRRLRFAWMRAFFLVHRVSEASILSPHPQKLLLQLQHILRAWGNLTGLRRCCCCALRGAAAAAAHGTVAASPSHACGSRLRLLRAVAEARSSHRLGGTWARWSRGGAAETSTGRRKRMRAPGIARGRARSAGADRKASEQAAHGGGDCRATRGLLPFSLPLRRATPDVSNSSLLLGRLVFSRPQLLGRRHGSESGKLWGWEESFGTPATSCEQTAFPRIEERIGWRRPVKCVDERG